MEYSGCPNTEEVRHPAEISASTNARFQSTFVSMAGFSVQWVHCFLRPFKPAKKNVWWLINTRHVPVNACCCLKGANSIGCFDRSTSFCWSQAIGLLPICLLYHTCRKCVVMPQPSYIIKMDCNMSTMDRTSLENPFLFRFCSYCYQGDDLDMQHKAAKGEIQIQRIKRDLNPFDCSCLP